MTVFENDIGAGAHQMTFDGTNLWTVNLPSSGGSSISRVDVGTGIDSTFTTGFDFPDDILWDGANLWVADGAFSALKRVDPATGTVVESITVQQGPQRLLFDGTNLWITSRLNGVTTNDISVVRAAGSLRGTVLTYLSSAGGPVGMAFDGERILICNYDGNTVSLFMAADFSPLATVSTGTGSANAPFTACSDGLNFWLTKPNGHQIVRF
jgi:DNA-binding beta-propeller fold protein YncE